MEKIRIRDPGLKKLRSGVRDKHPGSATLVPPAFRQCPRSVRKLILCPSQVQGEGEAAAAAGEANRREQQQQGEGAEAGAQAAQGPPRDGHHRQTA
jgi:hypothetical protein